MYPLTSMWCGGWLVERKCNRKSCISNLVLISSSEVRWNYLPQVCHHDTVACLRKPPSCVVIWIQWINMTPISEYQETFIFILFFIFYLYRSYINTTNDAYFFMQFYRLKVVLLVPSILKPDSFWSDYNPWFTIYIKLTWLVFMFVHLISLLVVLASV